MATLQVVQPTAFQTDDLWVANSGISTNEAFEGLQSSTGNPIIGVQTQTYSQFTFEVGALKYIYEGEWTIQYNRGVVTGSESASGYYDTIRIESGGSILATYSGPAIAVDFGSASNVPVQELVADNLDPLLISDSGSPISPANLYLDPTPNLPNIAFVGNDAQGGNSGADSLSGYDGQDSLIGRAGNDRLDGGNGGDVVNGGAGADILIGGAGIDYASYGSASGPTQASLENPAVNTGEAVGDSYSGIEGLIGSGFNDSLIGNGGDNTLIGGGGADMMFGRSGNDVYFVDNAGDRTFEGTGQGTADRAIASVSYTLNAGAQVELMSTTNNAGASAINLTGNEFSNTIFGNAGANTLNGGGGAAADMLVGFGGNDLFYVNHAADRISEAASGGADRVLASVSYALNTGAQVEVMSTSNNVGTTALNLTGNELAQTIFGNVGANVLNGGLGNDMLVGMGGADTFFFNTAPNAATNVDRINGFSVADDGIRLENAVFAGLANGTLAPGAFNTGTAATQADDRIIHEIGTGRLFFDQDGLGGVAAVHFATLTAVVGVVSNNDFFVV